MLVQEKCIKACDIYEGSEMDLMQVELTFREEYAASILPKSKSSLSTTEGH